MIEELTDKELILLAAKAAGIEGEYHEYYEAILVSGNGLPCTHWNPLTNKDDAFELMVDFFLTLMFDDVIWIHLGDSGQVSEAYGDGIDNQKAARRVITKAAAVYGKEMP